MARTWRQVAAGHRETAKVFADKAEKTTDPTELARLSRIVAGCNRLAAKADRNA